jgi:hypothetical protein
MSKSVRTSASSDSRDGFVEGRTGSDSASPNAKSPTRRNLLQIGAGLAAATGLPRGLGAPALAQNTLNVPKTPNIVVLMTDRGKVIPRKNTTARTEQDQKITARRSNFLRRRCGAVGSGVPGPNPPCVPGSRHR